MTALHTYAAEVALALPETACSQPFGEGCDVYKVIDKVFMLSFHLEGKAAINLKVLPDHGAMLRDIYPYIRAGWHMNKQHWNTVILDGSIPLPLLLELIDHSYNLIYNSLPQKTRNMLEGL